MRHYANYALACKVVEIHGTGTRQLLTCYIQPGATGSTPVCRIRHATPESPLSASSVAKISTALREWSKDSSDARTEELIDTLQKHGNMTQQEIEAFMVRLRAFV